MLKVEGEEMMAEDGRFGCGEKEGESERGDGWKEG